MWTGGGRHGVCDAMPRYARPVRRDGDPCVEEPAGQRDVRRVGGGLDRATERACLLALSNGNACDCRRRGLAMTGEQRLDRVTEVNLRSDRQGQVRLRYRWQRGTRLSKEPADRKRIVRHPSVMREAR